MRTLTLLIAFLLGLALGKRRRQDPEPLLGVVHPPQNFVR